LVIGRKVLYEADAIIKFKTTNKTKNFLRTQFSKLHNIKITYYKYNPKNNRFDNKVPTGIYFQGSHCYNGFINLLS